MKKLTGFLFLAVFVLLVGRATAGSGKAAVVWPASDIKWTDNAALKGAKIAVLWGDPKTGAYGALKTLPAGSDFAMHTHTHDQRVIEVSGTIVLTLDGSAAKELTPGSFAMIPGGTKHTASCKAGADCTYFEEQDGAADIKFSAAPKK